MYDRKITTINLSYVELFKDIYKDHFDFCNKYENSEITIDINKIKKYYSKPWHIFLNLYDVSFLSYPILQFFENECDKYMQFKNSEYTINIIYCSSDTSMEKINNIIYHIYNILNWLKKLSPIKKEHLILDIILCPFEKSLSYQFSKEVYNRYEWLKWTKLMKDDIIRPFNINTGVSYTGKHHIILYRLDELFKVLIHECIHSFKYDFQDRKECNNQNCDSYIKKNVNFLLKDTYPILYNEAYTEYLAIICWNYYLTSYYFQNNIYKLDNKFKLFNHMIVRETINSALECCKLFKFYKINDLKILNRENNISQYTNAFSYIFLKYIFLINIVSIFENKSALELNTLLTKEFNDIQKYNYLIFDIEYNNKINLSLYSLLI